MVPTVYFLPYSRVFAGMGRSISNKPSFICSGRTHTAFFDRFVACSRSMLCPGFQVPSGTRNTYTPFAAPSPT